MEKLVSDKGYGNTSLHSIYGVQHIISKETLQHPLRFTPKG